MTVSPAMGKPSESRIVTVITELPLPAVRVSGFAEMDESDALGPRCTSLMSSEVTVTYPGAAKSRTYPRSGRRETGP